MEHRDIEKLKTARHRTAISRTDLSRPIRSLLNDGLLHDSFSLFDYGCGLGDDIRLLANQGINCSGWDPIHYPKGKKKSADFVNLGYVVNVIEDSDERIEVLREAWGLTRKLLIVTSRLNVETRGRTFDECEDGYITQKGTFQKFFQQSELKSWINESLDCQAVPAAPGVFYVFRDSEMRESFLASRYRRWATTPKLRKSDILFEKHESLLKPLMEFFVERGRLPADSEISNSEMLQETLGSVRKAFRIIQRVTGEEQWRAITSERAQDLLVYLALARFDQRPKKSQLPVDIRMDVKAFYSNYSSACAEADNLLFSAGNLENVDQACRNSPVGKQTGNALYVHASAIGELPHILRVYEGCARAYIGVVEGANIIKLHRRRPQISYLSYPHFDDDPHPVLLGSLVVKLNSFEVQYWDYSDSSNPPILHRKEEFVSKNCSKYEGFRKVTEQEEKRGFYKYPEKIGTRDGWERLIRETQESSEGF